MTVLRSGDRGRAGHIAANGLGLLAWGGAAHAATVVAIDSGDTLRVREGGTVRTVRLACLEAPELSQAPHGERAKATLQRLLPVGSAVLLTPFPRASAPPGVTVAEVATSAGPVNLELVRAGQAFTTLDGQPLCDPLRYAEAENTARFRRLGVWQVEGGLQRPREWRIARAEAEARRAREQALQAQLRRERTARPPDIGPPPRQGPLAARWPTGGPEIQQQCVATAREKFLEGSGGIAPPPGALESFCTCLTHPKANDTPNTLGERCTRGLLLRVSAARQAG